MRRPWNDVVIADCGESLVSLKSRFLCLEPHPYVRVGAPYGEGADPYRLRSGVLERLHKAQDQLSMAHDSAAGSLQLAIFDAWRPVQVQAYMVLHATVELCRQRGIDPDDPAQLEAMARVQSDVSQFWAPPSRDPGMPPPHSTGAAVDLTLADITGTVLPMGGEIDAIGEESIPDAHASAAEQDPSGDAALWHRRRCLLHDVMKEAGFVRHPNEWWHFSHGDQLWAWSVNAERAIYASVPSS
ncbi:M15 family metallopeptidase [Synechococcus sp. A15-60]|uniref:M15 family metallopeptidase n=1 Tax=Synechococcus sp. A15-60 TaxID=1050655 RepID=UPI0016451759|nr:M15 family metallopeptidase [Synechococcus sp. A15-60]QNI48568.1 D-alanyl-D-alanine dipeptidase [Synechococcus sp. A15-60]